MSIVWILIAFFSNGVAQFLQKYLHAAGLGSYQKPALILMYVSGALFALALLAGFHGKLSRNEILFGIGVGITSYAGNAALLRALGSAPAYVVFPLVVGGPIITVAAFSHLFQGERLSTTGKMGLLFGVVAIILLTVG